MEKWDSRGEMCEEAAQSCQDSPEKTGQNMQALIKNENMGAEMQNNSEFVVPKDIIRVSVRNLVEFILRHGDIDNRRQGSPDNAMQEGSRIHRMIQKRMGGDYQAEVSLRTELDCEYYQLVVEGRADGIGTHDGLPMIDEIKGTYRNPVKLREPFPLHLAQAKCYAYIYASQNNLQEIVIRITYCHIPTEEIRYFYQTYDYEELKNWFLKLTMQYRKWADYTWQWKQTRQQSIQGLAFPFPYREGQKELVEHVYRTIYHKRKLFLEAPTGVGKTISTVYPAIMAMGQGKGDKLFYLTAKTITRTVAEEALNHLRSTGLRCKSVILTAKEKICFMDEVECQPLKCPYAKGHFDRINDAIYDLLTSTDSFTREKIEEYAQKHQVCPFEMCLDMSLFADAVIGDYNYLFDPHACLKRFFQEKSTTEYLFLIDEAHNLLERGREMYSAGLCKDSFLKLRREIKKTIASAETAKGKKADISGQLTFDMTENMTTVSVKENIEEESNTAVDQIGTMLPMLAKRSVFVKEGYAAKLVYQLDKCNRELLALKRECDENAVLESLDAFVQPLARLKTVLDDYLAEQEENALPFKNELLDFFFDISHFLDIYETLDENYVMYSSLGEDGAFYIKLFCMNPAQRLKECMQKGRSSILFSATFLPIQYYKKLLGGEEQDYEVYAKSVFDPEKRGLYIANDVTSKYTRRSAEEYQAIAEYIYRIVTRRHGNYMAFFPSYAFMHQIYDLMMTLHPEGDICCVQQKEFMSEQDREAFLNLFHTEKESMLVGFCVLGGVFGEGIDLKNDSLIGAIIVGTGIPQVCFERQLLKDFFDRNGESGFDYAYRYPGMNKVLQAAGRVIRTAEDVGIVALLDERFLQNTYLRMFPTEWSNYEIVENATIAKRVERFWDSWL